MAGDNNLHYLNIFGLGIQIIGLVNEKSPYHKERDI
jgi:hypothetical protein